jgi:hypothetical protein
LLGYVGDDVVDHFGIDETFCFYGTLHDAGHFLTFEYDKFCIEVFGEDLWFQVPDLEMIDVQILKLF